MQLGHQLSLAYLTVAGATPVEQIEFAAIAGFDAVGLRFIAPGDLVLDDEIVGNKSLIREITRACERNAIKVLDVEQWTLAAGTDVARYFPAVETAAEIGASFILCVSEDPDRKRAVDQYATLCDAAAPFGIRVALEFMKWREVKTIESALAFVNEADRPNGGVMIDTLHLSRSGGTPAAVAAIPPERLVYVQFCDAKAQIPAVQELRREARGGRLYPGEGALWLDELLDVLPPNIPISLEAPSSAHADRSVKMRAMLAGEAFSSFFARYRARRKECVAS